MNALIVAGSGRTLRERKGPVAWSLEWPPQGCGVPAPLCTRPCVPVIVPQRSGARPLGDEEIRTQRGRQGLEPCPRPRPGISAQTCFQAWFLSFPGCPLPGPGAWKVPSGRLDTPEPPNEQRNIPKTGVWFGMEQDQSPCPRERLSSSRPPPNRTRQSSHGKVHSAHSRSHVKCLACLLGHERAV